MSLDALRSALAMQRPENFGPKHKAVLLSLADHANAAGEAFVCRQQIIDETWFDRKSVSTALADLKAAGLIVDTGRRRGRTGQVIVWHLPWIEHRHEQARKRAGLSAPDYAHRPDADISEQDQLLTYVNQLAKQGPIRNSSEKGPLSERGPNRDGKRPENGRKEAPIRATEPPNGINPLPGVNPPAEGFSAQARPRAANGETGKGKNGQAKPKPAKPAASKRMVPEDFEPSDKDLQWAAKTVPSIATDQPRLTMETQRFIAHHRAKGTRFSLPHSAWRNWMLNAVEFDRRDAVTRPAAVAKPRYLE